MFNSLIYRDLFKPDADELKQCYKVLINQSQQIIEVRNWARTYCETFMWWESAGGTDDYVEFYFANEADAVIFKLRWG